MSTFQFGDQEMLRISKLNDKRHFSTIIIFKIAHYFAYFSILLRYFGCRHYNSVSFNFHIHKRFTCNESALYVSNNELFIYLILEEIRYFYLMSDDNK